MMFFCSDSQNTYASAYNENWNHASTSDEKLDSLTYVCKCTDKVK